MRTVGVAVLWLVCGPATAADPVPKYEGKPLGYWVARLEKASGKELDEAFAAVVAFGSDAAEAVPELVGMLHDRSFQYRQRVLEVFAAVGPAAKRATPDLVRMLTDKKARDPREVMAVLGAIGPGAEAAVPVLAEYLGDPDLSGPAADALGQIGPAAAPALVAIERAVRRAVAAEDGWQTYRLVAALGGLGPAAVPVLAGFLDCDTGPVAGYAADALGKMGPAARAAAPNLLPRLGSADPDWRLAAADALWRIARHPGVVPVLAELLTTEPEPPAVPAAIPGVYYPPIGLSGPTQKRPWPGSVRAAELLGEIGPGAAAALPTLEAAREGTPDVDFQKAVAAAVKKIRRPE